MRRTWWVAAVAALVVLGAHAQPSEEDEAQQDDSLAKIEALMKASGTGAPTITQMRLVRKQDAPIKGLQALVYDTMMEENGKPEPRRIVVFADPARKYMVLGTIIDIASKRDVAQDILSSIKDAKLVVGALRRVPLLPKKASRTVTLVVDLGPQQGRQFLLEVMRRRASFEANVELALVSNAKDQTAVGAQAIIAGSSGEEFFYDALAQWLTKGKDAPFLDKERLRGDKDLQARLGRGIFHIDTNTTELIEAGVKRLPLIFVSDSKGTRQASLPRSDKEWADIFGAASRR